MTTGGAGISRWTSLALAFSYLALLITQASIAPLQETDEGRSASIAWEMLASGKWITPHLNGIRYYEKPPLYYWLSAAALGMAGTSKLCVRFPSVLASFLTVLLTVHWGRWSKNERTGLLAGAILGSSILFALLARAAMVDPLLALCTTSALYAADRLRMDLNRTLRWPLLLWGSLGFAALVKGPVGIVLPLAALSAFHLGVKDWGGLRRLFHPAGLVLFAAICGPWYVAMSIQNPDYPKEFLLGQNLDRLIEGSRFNRDKPIWYYLPVALIGSLPWTLFLPRMAGKIRAALADRGDPGARSLLFLASAIIVPLLILSLAHSKLPHYLLPIFPPCALLLAVTLSDKWAQDSKFGALHLRILGSLMAAFALALLTPVGMDPETISRRLGYEPDHPSHDVDIARIRRFQAPLLGAAAIVGSISAAVLAAGWAIRRGRPRVAVGGLATAMLLGVLGVQFLVAPMGPAMACQGLASKAARQIKGDTPVILYRRYLRGMTFHLGKPVVLWDALYNEFGHELRPPEDGPWSLGASTEALQQMLGRRPDTILIVESPLKLEELRTSTSKMFDELDRDGEFIIVRVHR